MTTPSHNSPPPPFPREDKNLLRIFQFINFLGQIDQQEKDSISKIYDRTLVSEFAILAQKCSKIAWLNKIDFWVFAKHPAVQSGVVSSGRVHGCVCCS